MAWLFALCSVLLVSVAQLLMKWAMIQLPAVSQSISLLLALSHFSLPGAALLAGLFSYALSMFFWVMALRKLPLSRACPLLSLSYLLVWGGALLVPALNEQFHWGALAGCGLILAGLLLIFWRDKKER